MVMASKSNFYNNSLFYCWHFFCSIFIVLLDRNLWQQLILPTAYWVSCFANCFVYFISKANLYYTHSVSMFEDNGLNSCYSRTMFKTQICQNPHRCSEDSSPYFKVIVLYNFQVWHTLPTFINTKMYAEQ